MTDFQPVLVLEQVWREVENHRPDLLEYPGVEIQQVPMILSHDTSFQALVRALVLDLGYKKSSP